MQPVPTINVNLKPCSSGCPDTGHYPWCLGKPVFVPCPIQRSVTFTVRLRDCGHRDGHPITCPWPVGYVVKVSCSISGKTWAESEVEDISPVKTDGRGVYEVGWERGQVEPVTRAVHERWALVKALVLGRDPAEPEVPVTAAQGLLALFQQRDAVYAAIADMARAESVILQRFADIDKVHTNRSRRSFQGFAADELAAYVEHLVEQVGVMS